MLTVQLVQWQRLRVCKWVQDVDGEPGDRKKKERRRPSSWAAKGQLVERDPLIETRCSAVKDSGFSSSNQVPGF